MQQLPAHSYPLPAGGSTPVLGAVNLSTTPPPSLAINYIISLEGGFESTGDNQPFLGQISLFAGSKPPKGWEFCDGQLVRVNSLNAPLFSLLGTNYGGNGSTNFALPDLRGRVAVGEEKASA